MVSVSSLENSGSSVKLIGPLWSQVAQLNVILETLATMISFSILTSDFLCSLIGDPNPLGSARLPKEIQTFPCSQWPEKIDFPPSIWPLAIGMRIRVEVGLGPPFTSGPSPIHKHGVALIMGALRGISLGQRQPTSSH